MERLIKEFLSYLEKVATSNTFTAYRIDLKQFAQFCSGQGVTLEELNKALFLAYRDWLKRKKYSDLTIARRFAALRSFFNYLTAEGILRTNPLEGMMPPSRVAKVQPQILTIGEIAELLEMPSRSSRPEAIRDLAIMELLYSTGLRVTELVNLDVEMVSLAPENPYIRIIHRGGTRQISIPSRAIQALQKYLEEVRPEWLVEKTERALFLNRWGGRLTRVGVWLIIQEYVKKAGLEGRVSPKTLRASFIVHQLASGISPLELHQRLGYAIPEITSRYERYRKILQAKD